MDSELVSREHDLVTHYHVDWDSNGNNDILCTEHAVWLHLDNGPACSKACGLCYMCSAAEQDDWPR